MDSITNSVSEICNFNNQNFNLATIPDLHIDTNEYIDSQSRYKIHEWENELRRKAQGLRDKAQDQRNKAYEKRGELDKNQHSALEMTNDKSGAFSDNEVGILYYQNTRGAAAETILNVFGTYPGVLSVSPWPESKAFDLSNSLSVTFSGADGFNEAKKDTDKLLVQLGLLNFAKKYPGGLLIQHPCGPLNFGAVSSNQVHLAESRKSSNEVGSNAEHTTNNLDAVSNLHEQGIKKSGVAGTPNHDKGGKGTKFDDLFRRTDQEREEAAAEMTKNLETMPGAFESATRSKSKEAEEKETALTKSERQALKARKFGELKSLEHRIARTEEAQKALEVRLQRYPVHQAAPRRNHISNPRKQIRFLAFLAIVLTSLAAIAYMETARSAEADRDVAESSDLERDLEAAKVHFQESLRIIREVVNRH